MVEVTLENGSRQIVYFDTNTDASFALIHEDYLQDALHVDLGTWQVRVHVLSPVDLAVSKIAVVSPRTTKRISPHWFAWA